MLKQINNLGKIIDVTYHLDVVKSSVGAKKDQSFPPRHSRVDKIINTFVLKLEKPSFSGMFMRQEFSDEILGEEKSTRKANDEEYPVQEFPGRHAKQGNLKAH